MFWLDIVERGRKLKVVSLQGWDASAGRRSTEAA